MSLEAENGYNMVGLYWDELNLDHIGFCLSAQSASFCSGDETLGAALSGCRLGLNFCSEVPRFLLRRSGLKRSSSQPPVRRGALCLEVSPQQRSSTGRGAPVRTAGGHGAALGEAGRIEPGGGTLFRPNSNRDDVQVWSQAGGTHH
ncbi:hypothetical protein ILYODFUR_024793 [Ilyodon furcidens]|uniref:Uncharacterized protein n=1 Tax=Ilyodon furcidens TaxID=33524 RepID=A0ABV0VH98_9TELE